MPTQVNRPDPDTTDVFEHPGGKNDFLITDADVKAAGLDKAPGWGKIQQLTLRDMYHILGYSMGGKGSAKVQKLCVEDVQAIGNAFGQAVSMGYPPLTYACCCCADAEES